MSIFTVRAISVTWVRLLAVVDCILGHTRLQLIRQTLVLLVIATVCLSWAVPFALMLTTRAQAQEPAGRQTRFAEGLTFVYDDQDRAVAERLWPLMIADRQEVMERLQLHPTGTLRVYLAPTREDYARAHGGSAPESALGLYFGATRTVLLRSPRTLPTGTWDLRGVMRHELAHGVLDLAIDGPIPRWLHEGLAILVADEMSFLDDSRLTWLAFRDSLIPMHLLVAGFPNSDAGREVAYSQAASFARFLLGDAGPEGLQRLVGTLADGASLNGAFVATYGRSLLELEQQWQKALAGRFSWTALITPVTLFGGIGGPLVLIAYLKRRWQRHQRFQKWETEEEIEQMLLSGELAPKAFRPDPSAPSRPTWLN